MNHIKVFEEFIAEQSINEGKVKVDKKSYDELSQAIDKADTVEDIWNQLDSKLFPIEFNEFETMFEEWWEGKAFLTYETIREFAKNATKSDVDSLLAHIAKNKK
jgi:iron uptake system EfeUOB component EfeO/EfeM